MQAESPGESEKRRVPRLSVVALVAAVVILRMSSLGIYVFAPAASIAEQNCGLCQSEGESRIEQVLLLALIVFAIWALIWAVGYPRWYLRLPLLVISLAIVSLGSETETISPDAGILAIVAAVIGFAVAVWPASRGGKGPSFQRD